MAEKPEDTPSGEPDPGPSEDQAGAFDPRFPAEEEAPEAPVKEAKAETKKDDAS